MKCRRYLDQGVLCVTLALVGLPFSTWAAEATLGTDRHLWQQVLSLEIQNHASAIVEVRVVDGKAFEVVKTHMGTLKPGHWLSFDHCDRILMIGSTQQYLQRAVKSTPVLDVPFDSVRYTLDLPEGRQISDFPPAQADARYFMLVWRLTDTSWGFPRQTLGDFFLFENDRVFRLDYVRTDDLATLAWVPFIPAPEVVHFLRLVAQEIEEKQGF